MSGRRGICGSGLCKGVSTGLDRQEEYHRILDSFALFDVSQDVRALVTEALDSPRWDWFRDCDGCTGVSEVYWPNIYFPPCLRHDFDCKIGNNGWQTSRRFYRIQRAYGMGVLRAGGRFVGVTAAWYGWNKWFGRGRRQRGSS